MFFEQDSLEKEPVVQQCIMQEADVLTTAIGVALFWGFFFGARIPIAVAAIVVGLFVSSLCIALLYGIGVMDATVPIDFADWRLRLLSGIATFLCLAQFHIRRQRREGRPGW